MTISLNLMQNQSAPAVDAPLNLLSVGLQDACKGAAEGRWALHFYWPLRLLHKSVALYLVLRVAYPASFGVVEVLLEAILAFFGQPRSQADSIVVTASCHFSFVLAHKRLLVLLVEPDELFSLARIHLLDPVGRRVVRHWENPVGRLARTRAHYLLRNNRSFLRVHDSFRLQERVILPISCVVP